MGRHGPLVQNVVNRLEKSGIIAVRTCHVSLGMATPNRHHSVRKSSSCMDQMAVQRLRITGFGMIEDDLRIPNLIASQVELGQPQWHTTL